MTTTTKNLLSILFLAFSLMFLIAANNMANSAEILDEADCHHCGSVSACNDGGQPYGYPDCDVIEHDGGQVDCGIIGFPNCGSMAPPGEEPVE